MKHLMSQQIEKIPKNTGSTYMDQHDDDGHVKLNHLDLPLKRKICPNLVV